MSTTAAAEISREQLRAFHLSGRGLEHARPTGRLRPAGFDRILKKIPRLEAAYPLYAALKQAPRPLIEILGSGNETIVRDVIAIMGDRPLVPVAEVHDVLSRVLKESRMPADGYLIGFHPHSPALLYGAFLTLARRRARTAFFLDVKRCAAGLEDLLALDNACRSPYSAETVSASLGAAARRFLAPGALTGIFRQSRRGPAMDPNRRARCESTLAVLRKALEDDQRNPSFWLFHSGESPGNLAEVHGRSCRQEDGVAEKGDRLLCPESEVIDSVESVRRGQSGVSPFSATSNSCAAAIEFCDRQLAQFVEVLRAVRVARLEIESAFDAAVHSPLLDRFDWPSAEPDELAALPAVVIMEPPEQLAGLSLGSFARLLRSGRPVHILVPCCGSFPDLGYLAMAHRDAFVLQSSLASWDHLGAGLAGMTRTPGPAVAILSTPADGEAVSDAWIEAALYDFSRAFPLYRYDPSRDGQWTDRFQLFDPGESAAIEALTASSRFRESFRLIPPSASEDDQTAVPFLSVADAAGNQWRAVFTRELADFCHDRGRAWEMLAQLASVRESRNAGAGANLEAARQEAAAQAYDVVMRLLADPEKLVSGARENPRTGTCA